MLRARKVVAVRSWSTSQEPISEHWWADVLADPRAGRRRVSRGADSRRIVERAYYTLADEPHPTILVACSKCPWKAAFSRAELISNYGAEYPIAELARLSGDAGLLENQKPVGSVRRLLRQPNRQARTVAALAPREAPQLRLSVFAASVSAVAARAAHEPVRALPARAQNRRGDRLHLLLVWRTRCCRGDCGSRCGRSDAGQTCRA